MATSELCALCSDSMPNDGRYLKCDECAKVYHLGKKCSEYDSLVESSKSHDNVIKELQTEMSTLRSVLAEQAKEIQQLKSNQNDTDQTNRLPNLEIHGIPFNSNEKVADIMTDLAGKLKIAFQPAHM
ncbi:hypothetical protein HPB47_015162, partial [Ixodes persulcatus]